MLEVKASHASRGALADVAVSGLPGWVSIWAPFAKRNIRIRVWAPRGVEVFLRPPLPCVNPVKSAEEQLELSDLRDLNKEDVFQVGAGRHNNSHHLKSDVEAQGLGWPSGPRSRSLQQSWPVDCQNARSLTQPMRSPAHEAHCKTLYRSAAVLIQHFTLKTQQGETVLTLALMRSAVCQGMEAFFSLCP